MRANLARSQKQATKQQEKRQVIYAIAPVPNKIGSILSLACYAAAEILAFSPHQTGAYLDNSDSPVWRRTYRMFQLNDMRLDFSPLTDARQP